MANKSKLKIPRGLPKNAKKVFEGEVFDVWQWKQKMYDGSTEIFEKVHRPDTAQVIATVGSKIIILEEMQPHRTSIRISFPGGRIEEGEDPMAGAKRELLEETGFASGEWSLWMEQNPAAKVIWTIYTYIARDCRIVAEPKPESGEKIKVKMLTFEQFLKLADEDLFCEGKIGFMMQRARCEAKYKAKLRRLLFG